MASIIKRKKNYSVVYNYVDENGETKQKWETWHTHKEALKRKAEIENQQHTGTFLPPSNQTITEFLYDFVSLYGEVIINPAFINGTNLFQLNNGRFFECRIVVNNKVRRHIRFLMDSGGDRCHNQCGSVFITGIVLNDDNRTDAALFRPNYRVQLGAINITTAIYPIFFHHVP